jgi:hypothetical protein
MTCLLNRRRIHLHYDVKDAGPSGVSCVELWCTRDGKIWKRVDNGTNKKPPLVAEVQAEGLYGFTLVARNGLGASKPQPKPGDAPQVWVEVDLTNPTVQLVNVEPTARGASRTVVIRWTATDKNLAAWPISLSYREKAGGDWIPIAANLKNHGQYVWRMPAKTAAVSQVRVEALDLAGNIGRAESSKPLLIDNSEPTVAILDIEAAR